ncbi:amino acid adenylation domain-containing protein [Sinomicrobium weinanense]|uniref:Amino acid adenylation domain-containing protein n=1 Tax=Sinomicrobium weinanense TaxID=2842200 RepID=A0A926JQ12_9FLAO|nr:non-ribosomal peptide synthetase [Sinomicrobium weinanense]MBC9795256.1 amino acid adenylation domain-containing protein [Sinomicrobium weinanense]MBU3125728.1 amino acid adenylation domain-containing protein [Sinomicrobium weinanense]
MKGYKLSPQQQRYIRFSQHSNELLAQVSVIIEPRPDTDNLEKAIAEVFEHEYIFRTDYHRFENDLAVQVISEKTDIDLISYTRPVLEEELPYSLEKEWELASGLQSPKIRVALMPLEENRQFMVVTLPAVASDRESLFGIVEKVMRACSGVLQNPDEESLQYIQYAEWQNQLLTDEETEESVKYWKGRSIAVQPHLSFDRDPDMTKKAQFKGNTFELFHSVAELSKALPGEAPEILLSAAWYLILRKLFGDNFALGYVFSGRDFDELKGLSGLCAKTLPVSAEWEDNWSFKDALLHLKTEIENSDRHKEGFTGEAFLPYGFEYGSSKTRFETEGLTFRVNSCISCYEPFKLKLVLNEQEGAIRGTLWYNGHSFSKKDTDFLIDAYREVVRQMLDNAEAPLGSLGLLSTRYESIVLNDFNDTDAFFSCEGSGVDNVFESIAQTYGDRRAVYCSGQEATYAAIDERSDRLAAWLKQEYRVGPGDLVGIMSDKNIDLIVSLLAVIKSGAGFVPMDPDNPAERIQFIAKDCQARAVITTSGFKDRFRTENLVLLDEPMPAAPQPGNILQPRKPEDILYVIYTSGTTGNPKGTLVTDASLLNYISWFREAFKIGAEDQAVLLGSYAFDLGYTSIWGTLLSGGTLHLINDETLRNPEVLTDYLIKQGITFIKATPSLVNTIVNAPAFSTLAESALRMVLVGGEPVRVSDLRKIAALRPSLGLVNHYGPTEATIGAVVHRIDSEMLDAYAALPVIGSPIANTRIYILDEDNRPVAPGEPGELAISGKGLATGYLNRQELTAQKFIENPFKTGERLYKTGDIARWTPEGTVLFEGRKDDQVKIRGYRVELKEIQEKLESLKVIDKAEVTVYGSPDQGLELAAYYNPVQKVSLGELRKQLADQLPEYMLPSYFVELLQFPLTPNGKIDKKALPDPVKGTGATDMVPPRNELDRALLSLWQEILNKQEISITDDFFTIGGHSLKAIQLTTRLYGKLNHKIDLQEIFVHSTIEKLSDYLSQQEEQQYQPIPRLGEQEYYELSHAQHRLWILDQLEGDQIAYNMPAAFILEGQLNEEAFSRAFETLVSRHESLRTTFHTVNARAVQKIHPVGELDIRVRKRDLRRHVKPEEQAGKIAEEEAQTPFDLERGPMLRSYLLQVEDHRYVFVFNMHHIISDGWSLNVLTREVLGIYQDISQGRSVSATPLKVQYKDFAAWQNSMLVGDDIGKIRKYWLDTLDGELPVLDLPADYPRPSVQTYHGANHSCLLGEELSEKIHDFSRKNGVTLFMTLLSAVKVLLYRYTTQEDIIIGTPVAGREHPDLEDQIGFYVNTLAIRTWFNAEQGFTDLLEKVKKALLGAHSHQQYPFDRLVDDLNLERDLSRSALFDVMVSLSNPDGMQEGLEKFDTLRVSEYGGELTISKFDMSFDFRDTVKGLELNIEYNTDIYARDRVLRMAGHFTELISQALKHDEQPLYGLRIMQPEEEACVITRFNETIADSGKGKTLVDLFESQVENTPRAEAVTFGPHVLTYTELNEQANCLARYLLEEYQVKPGDRIGLLAGRSEKMITAVVGIMKTGAAYVPIDAEYPQDRIQYLIEDSSVTLLLTDRPQTAAGDIKVADMQGEWDSIQTLDKTNPGLTIDPEALVYMIYTSGSTGMPKGVKVYHRNVVNIAMAWKDSYHLGAYTPRLLQMAGISFDVFMGDFCRALLNGGNLIVCPSETRLDPGKLYELMARHQVNILESTPAVILPLMDHVYENELDLSFVELLIMGSDTCPARDFRNLVARFGGDMRIINSYGTTETTIDSSFYEAPLESIPLSGNVPIGKPMNNTQFLILDRHQQPVPVGVNGELYIGGAGVASGYHNRPELTAQRFVRLPFCDGVVYRTGDQARWLPDGHVAFLGRNDNQVKIRGYRIEPGEIENALLQIKGVTSAMVTPYTGPDGTRSLVAYFTGKDVEKTEIKRALQSGLPAYMVPSWFIELEKLPLTPNGKIDIKGLPAPDRDAAAVSERYVAPETPTEKALADIWGEVLNVSPIGTMDHFFELGGHSLKATQVTSRIYKKLGKSLELRNVFLFPTIRELARVVDRSGKGIYQPIEPVAIQQDYPLSYTQRRLWITDELGEGGAAYNISDVLEIEGELDITAFRDAFVQLVERHESLRTNFVVRDGEPRQKIHAVENTLFELEKINGEDCSEEELKTQIDNITGSAFDLRQDSLLRGVLIYLEKDRHLFVLVMHHIISDGWSSGILVKEVMALYEAAISGEENPLAPLPIQYKDYSVWYNTRLRGGELKGLQSYWQDKLSGELQPQGLLTDRPRGETKTYNGALCSNELNEELSEKLRELSKRESVSLYTTLLALVKLTLHKYSGREDIIVGSPVSGRDHEELEGQIGFYINNMILRTAVAHSMTFRELLQRVAQTAREGQEHQLYPYDRLVEDIKPEYDRNRAPVTDIWMQLYNEEIANGKDVEIAGLRIREFKTAHVFCKNEVTFNFVNTAGKLSLITNYNTDLFDDTTIAELNNNVILLAAKVVDAPLVVLSELSLNENEDEKAFTDTMFNI